MTAPTPWPTVVSLSGDPRIGSPTARLARRTAADLARTLEHDPTVVEIDLANVSARPEDLRRVVRQARALVVATPDDQGWPTPLLLDFLGGFALGALGGVPVVVLVTGARTDAAERRLRQYLHELGAGDPLPVQVLDAA